MATTVPKPQTTLFDGDVIDLTYETKPQVRNTRKINLKVDDDLELVNISKKSQNTSRNIFKPKINPYTLTPAINQPALLPVVNSTTNIPTNQFLLPINSEKGCKFLLVDQKILENSNSPKPHTVQQTPKTKKQNKLADPKSLTQLNFKNIGGKIVVEETPVVEKKTPKVVIHENVKLTPTKNDTVETTACKNTEKLISKQYERQNIKNPTTKNVISVTAQKNILLLPSSSQIDTLQEPLKEAQNDLIFVNNQREKKESTQPILLSSSLNLSKERINRFHNIKPFLNRKQIVNSTDLSMPLLCFVPNNSSNDQNGRNTTSYSDVTLSAEIELNGAEAKTDIGVIELSDDEEATGTENPMLLFPLTNKKNQTEDKQSIELSEFQRANQAKQSHQTTIVRKEKLDAKISNELFAKSLQNRWIDVKKTWGKSNFLVPIKKITEKKTVYYGLLDQDENLKETQPELAHNYSIITQEIGQNYSKTPEEVDVKSNETQQVVETSHGHDPFESLPLDPLAVVTPVDITKILNRAKQIDGRCYCTLLTTGNKGFTRNERKKPSCLKYLQEAISRDEKKIHEIRKHLQRRVQFFQCNSDRSNFLPETEGEISDFIADFNNIEEQLQTELGGSLPAIKGVISEVKNKVTDLKKKETERSGRSGSGSQEKFAKPEEAIKLILKGLKLYRNWSKKAQLENKKKTKIHEVAKEMKKRGRKKRVVEAKTITSQVANEVKKRERKKKEVKTTTERKTKRNTTNPNDFVYGSMTGRKKQNKPEVPLTTYRNKRKVKDYSDDLLIVKKVNILKKKRE